MGKIPRYDRTQSEYWGTYLRGFGRGYCRPFQERADRRMKEENHFKDETQEKEKTDSIDDKVRDGVGPCENGVPRGCGRGYCGGWRRDE